MKKLKKTPIIAKLKLWWRRQSGPVRGLVVAAMFAGIGSLFVFMTSAQKLYVMIDLDTGSNQGNAAVVSDKTAAGGKYLVFSKNPPKTTSPGTSAATASGATPSQQTTGGTSGSPNTGSSTPPTSTPPPAGSKPGAHNTGPTNRSILKSVGSMTITQAGAVIENVYVTGNIKIQANNVTLRNFVVDGGLYGIQATYGYSGIVIEDGELKNATSASIYGTGFTARRLNMHDNNGDGLKVQGNSLPTVVEWSWWHHLGKADGAHADGNQSEGTDVNVVFRYNHCDMPNNSKGGPGLPYKANSCFLGLGMNKTIIENNWLNGGNYTVYCQPGTVVRNNKMGRGYNFGLRSGTCGTWSGNTWEDTGAPA